MVTMTTAQSALKDIYLDVVSNQLNTKTNVLFNQFKQTTADVYGRDVQKLVPYGVNGGVGAGDEGGALPSSEGNSYLNFTSSLKNLFGTIEISDKAIRASADDAGAFVNLLTAEMEGLLGASKFNLGRMLYGDGTGCLTALTSASVEDGTITPTSLINLVEGMMVDFYDDDTVVTGFTGARITGIDRSAGTITINKIITEAFETGASDYAIYVQGSKGQELTGLEAIFATSGSIYGLSKTTYPWLVSFIETQGSGETFNEDFIQKTMDEVEVRTGNKMNFIVTTNALKRTFASTLSAMNKHVDIANLAGGYKALSFNGIPLYGDKFVPTGALYMLNTNDFAIHQLCDWEWLTNEDGSILKQKQGYASYLATLVKYAELVCSRPGAQGKMANLS